jgi:hypothetical protein
MRNINKYKRKLIIANMNNESSRNLFDRTATREIIFNGTNKERGELVDSANSLLRHYGRYPDTWEVNLRGNSYYRAKHEFSKDYLVHLGICESGDFCKNTEGKDKFAEVKFQKTPFAFPRTKFTISDALEKKLNRFHEGLYHSEIIVRSIDKTRELVHPEYMNFKFVGRVNRENAINLKKREDLLYLPKWRLFLENSEHSNFPLIARHYDLKGNWGEEITRRHPEEDIGEFVMAKSEEYAKTELGKMNIELRSDSQYGKIEVDPNTPITYYLRSNRHPYFR